MTDTSYNTLALNENFLESVGEMIEKTYSMGCHDEHGSPLSGGLPVGQRRDRTFDPTVNSNYTLPWFGPYELLRVSHSGNLTFLCHNTTDGVFKLEKDSIVMEVGARKKHGVVVAARSFAANSEYNRASMPEDRTTHNAISRSMCIGCQQVGQVAESHPQLKRVIIITSSKIIAEGVNKFFDWVKNGFAQGLPGGMAKEDWILLHHNIKALEDKGIAVKVWNVKRELILQACLSAWNRFLDLENAPINQDPHKCVCWECLVKKQLNEMEYAKTGVLCCPCAHSMSLIPQNLKRGDKFVITNVAGVTEPTLTMEVDPGNTFRRSSASSA